MPTATKKCLPSGAIAKRREMFIVTLTPNRESTLCPRPGSFLEMFGSTSMVPQSETMEPTLRRWVPPFWRNKLGPKRPIAHRQTGEACSAP